MDYKPQLLMWGSGAVLDAEGNEVGKVRIESTGLTTEQQEALKVLQAIDGDHS